jgi:aerobic carbon-monoxide dehydrogenase medium subunit
MKPAAFSYHRPRTLDDALSLLALHGLDAKVIAGGQSLAPMMNMRFAQPAHLIDLNALR